MNRLKALAQAPIAAALAWQGYLLLGRGFVYVKTEKNNADLALIRAEYFSQNQYWGTISQAEQEQPKNRATYNLICSYFPLDEYLVCIDRVAAIKIEISCFDHLKPSICHQNLMILGLFQPEDGILLVLSNRYSSV